MRDATRRHECTHRRDPVPARSMNRQARNLVLVGLLAMAPGTASAITCSVSATALGFGSYNTLSPLNTDATGTVSVTCSNLLSLLVSYDVLLSKGGAGSYSPRRLASGGNTLNYNLYTSILRTTIWGDGTGGSSKVTDGYLLGAIVPVTRNLTVYGRIPAQQNVASGTYTDSITVTVNY